MSEDSRPTLRRSIGVSLYVLAAAWGISQALSPTNGLLYLLLCAAIASAMTGWCVVDSRILGRPLLPVLQMITFCTWPVAVPIYLVWSRRLRGLGLAVLHAVGLAAVYLIAFWLAIFIVYGSAAFQAVSG